MADIELSIIIPAYNEEKQIRNSLLNISDFFHERKIEMILVDDGSTDRTYEIAAGTGLSGLKILRNYRNIGKGYSVKCGVMHSSGRMVFFSDVDLSTPLDEFPKLEKSLQDGFDIAIGSRSMPGAVIEQRQPFIRESFGKIFGIVARTLLAHTFMDTQCGFKLFRGDVARSLFSKASIEGFCFDLEILLIALKSGYRIKEIPVRWCNNPDTKLSLFSGQPIKIFLELAAILIDRFKGKL